MALKPLWLRSGLMLLFEIYLSTSGVGRGESRKRSALQVPTRTNLNLWTVRSWQYRCRLQARSANEKNACREGQNTTHSAALSQGRLSAKSLQNFEIASKCNFAAAQKSSCISSLETASRSSPMIGCILRLRSQLCCQKVSPTGMRLIDFDFLEESADL